MHIFAVFRNMFFGSAKSCTFTYGPQRLKMHIYLWTTPLDSAHLLMDHSARFCTFTYGPPCTNKFCENIARQCVEKRPYELCVEVLALLPFIILQLSIKRTTLLMVCDTRRVTVFNVVAIMWNFQVFSTFLRGKIGKIQNLTHIQAKSSDFN